MKNCYFNNSFFQWQQLALHTQSYWEKILIIIHSTTRPKPNEVKIYPGDMMLVLVTIT